MKLITKPGAPPVKGAQLFMATSFIFSIQSLLEIKDGRVTGPMSPVLIDGGRN